SVCGLLCRARGGGAGWWGGGGGARRWWSHPPPRAAPLRIAGRTLDTLPDPRRLLRQLLDDGATVFVEEADLSALGARARERLLPGVRRVAGAELVSRWSDYARVWFF
ncbi:hypothetical protein ACFXB5_34825, partial [Streptomyces sp. NPDC059455]